MVKGLFRSTGVVGKSFVALLALACSTTTVNIEPGKASVEEHRVRVDGDGPVISSSWSRSGDEVTGQFSFQKCRIERKSSTVDTRVTTRASNNTTSGLLLASGAAMFASNYMFRTDPKLNCDEFSGNCKVEEGSKLVPGMLMVGGLVLMVAGAVNWAIPTRVDVEPVNRRQDDTNHVGPCLLPRDLAQLSLVLRLPTGKLLPVHLSPNGAARVEAPSTAALPHDVDLPVVVYRVPSGAENVLARDQVVGSVRIEGAAPP